MGGAAGPGEARHGRAGRAEESVTEWELVMPWPRSGPEFFVFENSCPTSSSRSEPTTMVNRRRPEPLPSVPLDKRCSSRREPSDRGCGERKGSKAFRSHGGHHVLERKLQRPPSFFGGYPALGDRRRHGCLSEIDTLGKRLF